LARSLYGAPILSAAAASTGVASGSGGAAVTLGVGDGFGVGTGVGRGVGRAVATVVGEATVATWLGGWLTAAVPGPLHAAVRTAIGRRSSAAFRGEEMVDRTIGATPVGR